MVSLNRHCRCLYLRLVRGCDLSVALALLGFLCITSEFVRAAPITLRFDATVGPPRQGDNGLLPPVPPNWNIELEEGDTISGMFTFEPSDAPSASGKRTLVQPFDFTLQIKNRTLTTSQYGVEVFNNSTSPDMPSPQDHIILRCSSGEVFACFPPTVSPTDDLEWSFHLALGGDSTVLDGADMPADPSSWQRLIFADSMIVSFNDTQARRFYSFLATPNSFQAVPEPGTFSSVLVAAFVIFLSRVWLPGIVH